MTSREWPRRGVDPRARERLGALGTPRRGSDDDVDLLGPARRPVPAETEPATEREPQLAPAEDAARPAGAEAPGLRDDADDVLARLRSGALSVASTAYTAAHGHPLERPDPLDDAPTRRWALSLRSAIAVAAALLAIVAVVVLRAVTSPPEVVPIDGAPTAVARPTDPFAAGGESVVVHVVGEVGAPGVVELAPGSRVAEAVEAAGGPTSAAVLDAVNLARVVADGEQIVVPAAGEEGGEVGGAAAAASDGLVDLNTADAAALETLPGVGPVLAGRILAWRAEHGRFSSVDELAEISGIGPSLLARLSDLVRV